jgi:DsbC/DsbD-like thiol-disulfide interchange protein
MKYLFTLTLAFCFSMAAFAQSNPVSWTTSVEKVAANEYKIILTAEIDKGWAVYSQYLESDEGPVATSIYWDENDLVERVGKAEEEGKIITGHDQLFDMTISKYKNEVKLIQTVKAKSGTTVSGAVEFMCCNDQSCLPPKEVPFSLTLK